MWARWCLGSIGGLAEVARRGDSVGKWDMNNLCGILGLVGRGWSVVWEVGDGGGLIVIKLCVYKIKIYYGFLETKRMYFFSCIM